MYIDIKRRPMYVCCFCITFQVKSTQSRYIRIWKRKSGRAYEDDYGLIAANGSIGR